MTTPHRNDQYARSLRPFEPEQSRVIGMLGGMSRESTATCLATAATCKRNHSASSAYEDAVTEHEAVAKHAMHSPGSVSRMARSAND